MAQKPKTVTLVRKPAPPSVERPCDLCAMRGNYGHVCAEFVSRSADRKNPAYCGVRHYWAVQATTPEGGGR
jgi:hypothetical protein